MWFDLASMQVGKPSANTMLTDKGSGEQQSGERVVVQPLCSYSTEVLGASCLRGFLSVITQR